MSHDPSFEWDVLQLIAYRARLIQSVSAYEQETQRHPEITWLGWNCCGYEARKSTRKTGDQTAGA